MFAEHVLLHSPALALFMDDSQTSWTVQGESSNQKAATKEEKKPPPHLPSSSLYTVLEIYLQFISTSGLHPGQEITSKMLPPLLPKCSSHIHTAFPNTTICIWGFPPTFAIPVPMARSSQVVFSSKHFVSSYAFLSANIYFESWTGKNLSPCFGMRSESLFLLPRLVLQQSSYTSFVTLHTQKHA